MKEWLNSLKTGPCVDCGRVLPPEILDFDHTRGNKLAKISAMRKNCSLAKLKTELDKCDLVCPTCHRIRTHERAKILEKS